MQYESHILSLRCDQCQAEISQNKLEIKFGGGPFGNGWFYVKETKSSYLPVGIHDKPEDQTEWHFCSMGCLSNWSVDKA
jgi:hypothetical protein